MHSRYSSMEKNTENHPCRKLSCCRQLGLRSWPPVCCWAASLGRLSTIWLIIVAAAGAQNVTSSVPSTATLKPTTVSDENLQRVIELVPAHPPDEAATSPRLVDKLENHVRQLVDSFPYQAFQHTHFGPPAIQSGHHSRAGPLDNA